LAHASREAADLYRRFGIDSDYNWHGERRQLGGNGSGWDGSRLGLALVFACLHRRFRGFRAPARTTLLLGFETYHRQYFQSIARKACTIYGCCDKSRFVSTVDLPVKSRHDSFDFPTHIQHNVESMRFQSIYAKNERSYDVQAIVDRAPCHPRTPLSSTRFRFNLYR
jgi:hypothetical protein